MVSDYLGGAARFGFRVYLHQADEIPYGDWFRLLLETFLDFLDRRADDLPLPSAVALFHPNTSMTKRKGRRPRVEPVALESQADGGYWCMSVLLAQSGIRWPKM